MDVQLFPSFLDVVAREAILRELRSAEGAAAPVYGIDPDGAVRSHVRSVERMAVPASVRQLLEARFEALRPELERRFGVALSHGEEPQFLHYREGDFFVAHQDGNTALVRDETRFRRVSAVLFLNEQSESPQEGTYGGGDLQFHGEYPNWQDRFTIAAEPGTLVTFRSEATHEVLPVIHGDRYTIVCWYRAA